MMECFVEDLLAYKMIQEGAFHLNPISFSPVSVLDFIKSIFGHKTSSKGVTITTSFRQDRETKVQHKR